MCVHSALPTDNRFALHSVAICLLALLGTIMNVAAIDDYVIQVTAATLDTLGRVAFRLVKSRPLAPGLKSMLSIGSQGLLGIWFVLEMQIPVSKVKLWQRDASEMVVGIAGKGFFCKISFEVTWTIVLLRDLHSRIVLILLLNVKCCNLCSLLGP